MSNVKDVGDRLYAACKAARKNNSSGEGPGHGACGGKTFVTEEEWKSAGDDDDKRTKKLFVIAKSTCHTVCDCLGSVRLIIQADRGSVVVRCNDGSTNGFADLIVVNGKRLTSAGVTAPDRG